MKIKQYLSLFFPTWSVDLARKRQRQIPTSQKNSSQLQLSDSTPIVLTERVSQQVIVRRFCPQAKRIGIREGISLELARALAGENGLYHEALDVERDFQELKKLAQWCITFSPCVGLDPELLQAMEKKEFNKCKPCHFGIMINLSGTERLHRDFYKLSERLFALFYKKGFKLNLALAPTIGSAWAFSRYGKSFSLVEFPQLETQLSALPVHALRLDDECITKLEQVGVFYIKELFALPRNALKSRFGLSLICRIEQALGTAFEDLRTISVPKEYFVEKRFEYPLHKKEAVVRMIELSARHLLDKLNQAKKSTKRFRFIIRSSSDTFIQKDFLLSEDIADSSNYSSVVTPMVENLTFFEEVCGIAVQALDVRDSYTLQNDFHGRALASDTDVVAEKELLNTFTVKLGKNNVTTLSLRESYLPERAFSYTSVTNQGRLPQEGQRSKTRPLYTLLERPSILYATPEPIKTISMLPDKPPSFIQWQGKSYKIITGLGPERITGEWWEGKIDEQQLLERDYFRVQDEKGRWLWIYRDKDSFEWFVQGVWG